MSTIKRASSEEQATLAPQLNRKLFLTNIPPANSTQQVIDRLTELIQQHEKIVRLDCRKNFNHNFFYAFVEFENNKAASNVLSIINGMELDGKKLRVEFQKSGKSHISPKGRNGEWKEKEFPRDDKSREIHEKYPRDRERNQRNRGREGDRDRHDDREDRRDRDYRARRHSPRREDSRRHREDSRDRYRERSDRHRRNRSPSRDQRRKERERSVSPQPQTRRFGPGQCYNCGSTDHQMRQCPEPKRKFYKERSVTNSPSQSDRSESSHRHRRVRRRSASRSRDNRRERSESMSPGRDRYRRIDERKSRKEVRHRRDSRERREYRR